MTRRLRITLSARAVIARGYEFSPQEGSFADSDVALDEILSLPTPVEPIVLRVAAQGGAPEERGRVAGDWLCDVDGSRPLRIPQPVWEYSAASRAWARRKTWLDAWEQCKDGRWMALALAPTHPFARALPLAVAYCKRILGLSTLDNAYFFEAVRILEGWGSSKPDGAQAETVRANVRNMPYVESYANFAISAAIQYSIDLACGAGNASSVAFYAVEALRAADDVAQRLNGAEALAEVAEITRLNVPTIEVLRALTRDASQGVR